jgi:hypothetical protein
VLLVPGKVARTIPLACALLPPHPDDVHSIRENLNRLKSQRSMIDLPTLMLPWFGFIWSAGQASNPLIARYGLPSAAFVEMVYGNTGIDLTRREWALRNSTPGT